MSFGFSPSDVIALINAAVKTYQGWKNACGVYGDIAVNIRSLITVLKKLDHETDSGNNILKKDREELLDLTAGCKATLKSLNEILQKYPSLGSNRKSNWDRIRLGRKGKDVETLRSQLVAHVSLITVFLSVKSWSTISRVERAQGQQKTDTAEQSADLKDILHHVKKLYTRESRGRNYAASVASDWTNYANDDKKDWRDLRSELNKEGFDSKFVKRHERQIKNFLATLREEPLSSDAELPHSSDEEANHPDVSSSNPPENGQYGAPKHVSEKSEDERSAKIHEKPNLQKTSRGKKPSKGGVSVVPDEAYGTSRASKSSRDVDAPLLAKPNLRADDKFDRSKTSKPIRPQESEGSTYEYDDESEKDKYFESVDTFACESAQEHDGNQSQDKEENEAVAGQRLNKSEEEHDHSEFEDEQEDDDFKEVKKESDSVRAPKIRGDASCYIPAASKPDQRHAETEPAGEDHESKHQQTPFSACYMHSRRNTSVDSLELWSSAHFDEHLPSCILADDEAPHMTLLSIQGRQFLFKRDTLRWLQTFNHAEHSAYDDSSHDTRLRGIYCELVKTLSRWKHNIRLGQEAALLQGIILDSRLTRSGIEPNEYVLDVEWDYQVSDDLDLEILQDSVAGLVDSFEKMGWTVRYRQGDFGKERANWPSYFSYPTNSSFPMLYHSDDIAEESAFAVITWEERLGNPPWEGVDEMTWGLAIKIEAEQLNPFSCFTLYLEEAISSVTVKWIHQPLHIRDQTPRSPCVLPEDNPFWCFVRHTRKQYGLSFRRWWDAENAHLRNAALKSADRVDRLYQYEDLGVRKYSVVPPDQSKRFQTTWYILGWPYYHGF